MDTEKLKVIAEGMGYEATIQFFEGCSCYIKYKDIIDGDKDCAVTELYNPLTNNDQMVEIMEKHVDAVTSVNNHLGRYRASIEQSFGYGETYREAVCNAAYEYFK